MSSRREALAGTSLRVYRYIFKHGPTRLSDIQRDLKMSSSSVAEYHLQKLVRLGLIHEGDDGYVADRLVFENMVRFRRTVIPLWAAFSAFLTTSLLFLITLLRPPTLTSSSYVFSLITIALSLLVSLYQTLSTLRQEV